MADERQVTAHEMEFPQRGREKPNQTAGRRSGPDGVERPICYTAADLRFFLRVRSVRCDWMSWQNRRGRASLG